MEAIKGIIESAEQEISHKILIIEDASHALG
jgi:dTDP-4-amino-4,6-dideoxygalactose transaminase